MVIQEIKQSIQEARQQLGEQKEEIGSFDPRVQLTREQLIKQTPTSRFQVKDIQKQRYETQQKALSNIQEQERKLSEQAQSFEEYLRTPEGIKEYSREFNIKPEIEYVPVLIDDRQSRVAIYTYKTPYGTYRDESELRKAERLSEFYSDVKTMPQDSLTTARLQAKYGLTTSQAALTSQFGQESQKFEQQIKELQSQGLKPIIQTRNGTQQIIGYEDTKKGMTYSIDKLNLQEQIKTPTQVFWEKVNAPVQIKPVQNSYSNVYQKPTVIGNIEDQRQREKVFKIDKKIAQFSESVFIKAPEYVNKVVGEKVTLLGEKINTQQLATTPVYQTSTLITKPSMEKVSASKELGQVAGFGTVGILYSLIPAPALIGGGISLLAAPKETGISKETRLAGGFLVGAGVTESLLKSSKLTKNQVKLEPSITKVSGKSRVKIIEQVESRLEPDIIMKLKNEKLTATRVYEVSMGNKNYKFIEYSKGVRVNDKQQIAKQLIGIEVGKTGQPKTVIGAIKIESGESGSKAITKALQVSSKGIEEITLLETTKPLKQQKYNQYNIIKTETEVRLASKKKVLPDDKFFFRSGDLPELVKNPFNAKQFQEATPLSKTTTDLIIKPLKGKQTYIKYDTELLNLKKVTDIKFVEKGTSSTIPIEIIPKKVIKPKVDVLKMYNVQPTKARPSTTYVKPEVSKQILETITPSRLSSESTIFGIVKQFGQPVVLNTGWTNNFFTGLGTMGAVFKIPSSKTESIIEPVKVTEFMKVKPSIQSFVTTQPKQLDITKTRSILQLQPKTREIERQKSGQMLDILQVQPTKQLQRQPQKLIQRTVQEQRQPQKLIQRTVQEQRQPQRLIQRQDLTTPTTPTPNLTIPVPIVPYINLTSSEKKALKSAANKIIKNGFDVYVRRKGKDVKQKTVRTKFEASKLLTKKLKGTLAASGFVVEKSTGKIVKFGELGLTPEFRPSKRNDYRVVQKRKFRLGTGMEVFEIQKSRSNFLGGTRTKKSKKFKWV